MNVMLVALYRYQNIPIRILHPLLKRIDGIYPHTIFMKNYNTNMFAPPSRAEEVLFVDLLRSIQPTIVGFSVLAPYFHIAKRLTKLVKDFSDAKVIWGGVYPTIEPELCIQEADIVCVGEGEGAMVDLVERFKEQTSIFDIPNLWIRVGEEIYRNQMRPLVQDLDLLPFAAYGEDAFYFINNNKLSREDEILLGDFLMIQTSRGCPFVCSFCVNSLLRPLFKGLGPYTRRKSVTAVIDEIKYNLTLPGNLRNDVMFIDEVFGSDRKWLDEFATRYKNEINLPFSVEYNPKILNESILERLVAIGLHTVNFGIQTGSDYIRNEIFTRPGTNEEIVKLATSVARYGVTIKYDLLMDNPYNSEADLRKTMALLIRLPKPMFFHLFSLQYFPKYPLTERALQDGYITLEQADLKTLMATTTKNWAFIPSLHLFSIKHCLQNVIWLIVWGHVKDVTVRRVLDDDDFYVQVLIRALSVKAFILYRLLGDGRGVECAFKPYGYFVKALRLILRGEVRVVVNRMKRIFQRICFKHLPNK